MKKLWTIKDVSEILQVNERTILRLIQADRIPATKIGNQWRFHPAQLETWFMNGGEQSIHGSGNGFKARKAEGEYQLVSEKRVLFRLEAATAMEAIERMIDTLSETGHLLQKEIFTQSVQERERHSTTGIGNGVALPHAWHPINDLFRVPLMVCARLVEPVDFMSVDGAPVDLIFLLCAPRNEQHLHLLSTMSRIARDIRAVASLRAAQTKIEFIQVLQDRLAECSVDHDRNGRAFENE